MNMLAQNDFLRFQALGYDRLVPVIPPGVPISPNSSLFKRVGTNQDSRGKTPGIKGQNGDWFSFDWLPYQADSDDHNRWAGMGAGVGIKTGHGLVLIDADTSDKKLAEIIRDTLSAVAGGLPPVRVGNYPKAGYLVRTDPAFQYTRIEFGERDDKGRLLERVEILAEGRFFVAHGIHPKTGKPYEWPKGVPAYDDLPYLSPAQLVQFLNALKPLLPAASELVKEGATTEINQQALKGDLQTITKAVSATPNTSALFPTREAYRDFGYAIKAALPDHQAEAFEIYADWCDRWQDGTNDPDVVAADWSRMKGPFRRGAGWLYELADKHSAGAFTEAEAWFAPIVEDDNPFAVIAREEASQQASDTYRLLTIDEVMNRPPPTWLIDRHIPDKSVGFLYSEPGVGKSFLALDMALTVAHGLDQWHGDPVKHSAEAAVVYIASEGSFDMGNRLKAWHKAKQNSGYAQRFYLIEQTINFMNADDVARLLRTLASVSPAKPVLVVVDTVSRALPGADENLQKDMTLFVRACDAVRDAYSCAVLGIHHAGKSGDMRGSTVLLGAGDFVFRLARKKGATIGTLTCEKQKAAPDGWDEPYRFDVVRLEGDESSLVVERAENGIGPSVALTPDVSASVLEAMRKAWDDGLPWSRAPQSKDRYAVRRMVSDFGFDAVRAEDTLALWEQTGLIAVEITSSHSKLKGYKVSGDIGQTVQNDGIFG